MYGRADFLGLTCDVTSERELAAALEAGARAFGGLDMLVLNAGIFPGGRRIDALDATEWRRVMGINLDANLALHARMPSAAQARAERRARRGHRLQERAGAGSRRGGLLGVEGGAHPARARRRAGMGRGPHPRQHRCIPTRSSTRRHLDGRSAAARAATLRHVASRSTRSNNVLQVEVKSRDVAELAAEMCGPLFAKTTGAQVPVDGGNDRVI